MADFQYQDMFPLTADTTEYRLLSEDQDVVYLLRPSHLKLLAAILDDPESSANDRYVALEMLKNAVIAAEGIFPMCQDTGTAIIMGKKGQQVWTEGEDEAALSQGVFYAYTRGNLRYSQNAPLGRIDTGKPGGVYGGKDEILRDGGLSALSPGVCDRRDLS